MRNAHRTKKGPGRSPIVQSIARYYGEHNGYTSRELAALPADIAGSKLFRQAANKQLTIKS